MNSKSFVTKLRPPLESHNFNIFLFFLGGYSFFTYLKPLSEWTGYYFSFILCSVIYYSIAALIFRKFYYITIIWIFFCFLILFLSFRNSDEISFKAIFDEIKINSMSKNMFSFVFIPVVFMGFNIDFYALPFETKGKLRFIILFFLIPVLRRRELLKKRFETIMECLNSRGIECRSWLKKQKTVTMWLIPLAVTSAMEGTEWTNYNEMLKTDIWHYEPSRVVSYVSHRQILFLLFLCVALFVRVSICRNM